MNHTIEAAHFYLYEEEKGESVGFLEEQKLGVKIAIQVANKLGITPQFLLFIDDYHGNPYLHLNPPENIQSLLIDQVEVKSAQTYFQQNGIQPQIISEWELTSTAAHLYHLLLQKGVVAKGRRQLSNEFASVQLLTNEGDPTCSLIDAALYLKKIGPTRTQPTITVLPIRYKSQQDQVKQILAAFGVFKPFIIVIYHDDDGVVTNQEDWSLGGQNG